MAILSLERLLKVRRPEQPLLLLMVGTIALFQFCQIVNENFSETVFLKRYGVQYLPNTFFFSSLAFFAILFVLNRVVDRTARTRLVSRLLLVYAVLLLLFRLLILSGLTLAYPIIYIAVKQMKYVFFIVFWTLASDIYSTHKARRLFPIIGGGAVLGTIIGSMLSRSIALRTGTNNVVLFSSAGMVASYILVSLGRRYVNRFSPLSFSPTESLSFASFGKFLRRELLQWRGSSLLKYLVILSLLPGIVAPVFEYLFNYLADQAYGTEESLLSFFGYFKGSFNLLILMFQILAASAVFRRYGIINVLFANPVAYLLTFIGLRVHFSIAAAVVGKTGIEVIDAAFSKPGYQMLYNLIPVELRGRVSALVQGAVRRLGELGGSGMLWMLKIFVSPLHLTAVGPFFALLWCYYTYRLGRAYSSILYKSLSEKHVNFAELEGRDLRSLMTTRAGELLCKSLAAEKPTTTLMAARLMAQSEVTGWPGMICEHLPEREPALQLEMLRILGDGEAGEVVPALVAISGRVHPSTLPEILAIVRRMAPEKGIALFRQCLGSENPCLAAESVLGLAAAGEKVDLSRSLTKLDSPNPEDVRCAIYLLGEMGSRDAVGRLNNLAQSHDPGIRAECARSLGKLGFPVSSELWPAFLRDSAPVVRRGALEGLDALHSVEAVRIVVPALGDEDGMVREAARSVIEKHGEAVIPLLTAALPEAGLFTRAALIRILDDLGVKEETLLAFIDTKIGEGYRAVGQMRTLDEMPAGRAREVLFLLLSNRLSEAIYEIFRTLSLLLKGSQMQFILESYHHREESVREQALEALESILAPDLARSLLPLLEDLPLELKLHAGARYCRCEEKDICIVLEDMLRSASNADTLCGLMCVQEARERGRPPLTAALLMRAQGEEKRLGLEGGTTVEDLMEKVLTLKGVPIFSHLQFKELLAIASISRAETFYKGDTIVKQGERGYTMYIITSGAVRILSRSEGREVTLATLGENDYFGEMALFDDSPRSATAVAESEVRALTINKREFRDMLREYPAVSIMMCEEFCRRLRRTIEKVSV